MPPRACARTPEVPWDAVPLPFIEGTAPVEFSGCGQFPFGLDESPINWINNLFQ
jgi:hypothetical protein